MLSSEESMEGKAGTNHLGGYHRWSQIQIQIFLRSQVKCSCKLENVERAEFPRRMNYRVANTYHQQIDLGKPMQQLMWMENGKCKPCPDYPYDVEMDCSRQELATSKKRGESKWVRDCR